MKSDFCKNCQYLNASVPSKMCLLGYYKTTDPLVYWLNGDRNIPIYNKEVFIDLDYFKIPEDCPFHLELVVQ